MLKAFNIEQHVSEPTHKNGNTLDLLIIRADDDFNPALYCLIIMQFILKWSSKGHYLSKKILLTGSLDQ